MVKLNLFKLDWEFFLKIPNFLTSTAFSIIYLNLILTGELQKEISEQSSRQEQDLSTTSLNVSDINQDSIGSEAGSEADDSVLDVEGFIHEFLNKNFSEYTMNWLNGVLHLS